MRMGAPIRHPSPPLWVRGRRMTDSGAVGRGEGVDWWSWLPLNETAGGSEFWILEQLGTGLRPAMN